MWLVLWNIFILTWLKNHEQQRFIIFFFFHEIAQSENFSSLKVLLRIKESEIQYLKQEIHSLKDELQSALRVSETKTFTGGSLLYKRRVWTATDFSARTRNTPQISIRTFTQSWASWRRRPTVISASWRRSCSWPLKLWGRGMLTTPLHPDTVCSNGFPPSKTNWSCFSRSGPEMETRVAFKFKNLLFFLFKRN